MLHLSWKHVAPGDGAGVQAPAPSSTFRGPVSRADREIMRSMSAGGLDGFIKYY